MAAANCSAAPPAHCLINGGSGALGNVNSGRLAVGDELDELLQERFDLTRQDVVAALKTLPVLRPWAAALWVLVDGEIWPGR